MGGADAYGAQGTGDHRGVGVDDLSDKNLVAYSADRCFDRIHMVKDTNYSLLLLYSSKVPSE